jgi:hypothetical protein
MCLLPDADSADADSALRAPSVEVVLLCDAHTYEHTATNGATETAAITFEDLT